MVDEHDSCALVSIARKDGRPTTDVLHQAIQGLSHLAHRSGLVDGEGDGAGVLTDIPRALWSEILAGEAGLPATLASDPGFAVAHVLVPRSAADDALSAVRRIFAHHSLTIVHERTATTSSAALGPGGRSAEPLFWQIAFTAALGTRGDRALFDAAFAVERQTVATVASLSRSAVVYKLRGSGVQLTRYFADLADPRFSTSMALGHNRYSTNTSTTFERCQPFGAFAHNGEINTIARLREETAALGLPLSREGSDSQDVDALLRGLVYRLGLHPIEAVELVFPPIMNEIAQLSGDLQDLYLQARAAIGPIAQGPAGILSRFDDVCIFGVDAMGLRPLWHVETAEEHMFSSERGWVPLARYVRDPRPLGPGERNALVRTVRGWEFLGHAALRERFAVLRAHRRIASFGLRAHLDCGGPDAALLRPEAPRARSEPHERPPVQVLTPPDEIEDLSVRREAMFAAFGYEPDDLKQATFMLQTANEAISSLGYDGPLAVLSEQRPNVADFLQETVAVVTNPAVDREREIEHFSTRIVLGPRPTPHRAADLRPWVELRHPIILGGHAAESALDAGDYRALARSLGTWLLEDVEARFATDGARPPILVEADRDWEEHPRDALARIAAAACVGVRAGARLVVIRDRHAVDEGRAWLDPMLVTAAVHRALGVQPSRSGSLRRDCGLVVSVGSLRNLHDIVTALALGADAVNPYLLLEYAISSGDPDAQANLVEAMRKGIEKVISTLGIHEVRGYGRQLAAVGVAPEIARLLGVRTFVGRDGVGLDWERVGRDGMERSAMLRQRTVARLSPAFRIYPRVWKAALQAANGEVPWASYAERLREMEEQHPVALRHLLDIVGGAPAPDGRRADTRAGEHDAPFYISSMSFGSQGETAYRAYAEAAFRMNILCINGEGGELPDLYGRYPRNRGQQVASGRFGVSAGLTNSSDYLEIKIGQGAKPGEGGHLPARKVTAKVALARNATPGSDLISPSNNHDIYSIEDLAQVVHELKTVNPRARVAVKVPVVPEIGIIAVGVAKSGADIITLSGYDGGTGAARQHALRRAGMPSDLGVREAHRALVESGLRDRVELWCDGGMKSATDIVKMLCLGADRVGFGTLAMVAIGCTICRGCQLDTCHVGIATQIETSAEASDRGIKRFEPQELDRAVANLQRFFGAMREDLAAIAGALGVASTRELVGRVDLLAQVRGADRVDLTALLTPLAEEWSPAQARTSLFVAAPLSAGDAPLSALDRFVGTAESGVLARQRIFAKVSGTHERVFPTGSIAGNGFAAYATEGVTLHLSGGAQDGAAKSALGGTFVILKAPNAEGRFVDGSVGKCFAYGAQRGRFLVQGSADARAGIRLSGADVVFGGDLHGFAFEYMTAGRGVVLGDPGKWICSGMSGGVVYVRVDRALDEPALGRRLAKGGRVAVRPLAAADRADLAELLGAYADELQQSGQPADAERVRALLAEPDRHFRAVRPGTGETVDQSISTE